MRRVFFIILSIAVSAVFIFLVVRGIPLQDVFEVMAQADIGLVLLSFVMVTVSLFIRGMRWRALLGYRITTREAFFVFSITMMLNQLPLRAGEIARSFIVQRRGVPFVTAATSIVIERILDTLAVVILLVLALTQIPDVPDSVTSAANAFGAASVIAFSLLLISARYPVLFHRTVDGLERLLPVLKRLPLRTTAENVIVGLQPLTRLRTLMIAFMWTALAWAASLLTLIPLFTALGITGVPVVLSAMLGVSLASFSVAIPVSIASIGPFEAAIVLMGQSVGIGEVQSLALGVLNHGLAVLAYVLWGGLGFVVLGVSYGDLQEAVDEAEPGDTVVAPAIAAD